MSLWHKTANTFFLDVVKKEWRVNKGKAFFPCCLEIVGAFFKGTAYVIR